MPAKAQTTTTTKNKLNLIKIENCYVSKDTMGKKLKTPLRIRENICKSCM